MFKQTIKACFLLVLTLFSCQQEKSTVTLLPELLKRGNHIHNGNEWDFAQNFYAQQVRSITQGRNINESKLNLAELFVKEARITGEHGHYYPAALHLTNEILENEINVERKFRTLLTKAGVQLSLHEFNQALTTGKEAININAHNAQAYGVLVDCYVELGMYDKAIEMGDRMMTIKPDLRSYSRISYLREIHGDYQGAIEALTFAVKAGYPGYEETAWAMQTLGELYELYGEDEKAKSLFEIILEERNNYPFAVASLGLLAYKKGEVQKAEDIVKKAIEIIPEVGFYTQLAQIYKDQNRITELNQLLKEILMMLRDDVINGHNMNMEYAYLYLDLFDDPERALEFAKIEYHKRPDNIDVNRLLASIYSRQQNINKAYQHISAASITNSNHPQLEKLKALTSFDKSLSQL